MAKPIINQVLYADDDIHWMVRWGSQTHLPNFNNLNHWEIYRLIDVTNWKLVGNKTMIMVNGWYSWKDSLASTTSQPQQYKIKGVYNDGTKTEFSDIHKTQHLMVNWGEINVTVNIITTPYTINNVMPLSSIKIYKGVDGDRRMIQVAHLSMSNPYTTYTDQYDPNLPKYIGDVTINV